MGEPRQRRVMVEVALLFTVHRVLALLLFTSFGWGSAGGQANGCAGLIFLTLRHRALKRPIIFVTRPTIRLFLIVFARILSSVQIFSLRTSRAPYTAPKGSFRVLGHRRPSHGRPPPAWAE
uniref:Secreted protein n=1 Tax=Macrostomum lignano TaxID=282301 RepID=A0A1I8FGM6_9PLAT